MKRKNTKNKILLIVVTSSVLLTFFFLWYPNSKFRAEYEHSTHLPSNCSGLKTYGNGWKFWKKCGRYSSTFFSIPREDFETYISTFTIFTDARAGTPAHPSRIRSAPKYFGSSIDDFSTTNTWYVQADNRDIRQEISLFDNGKIIVVGIASSYRNECD